MTDYVPREERRDIDFADPRSSLLLRIEALVKSLQAPTIKTKFVDLAPDYQWGEVLSVQEMLDAGYVLAIVEATRGTWRQPNFLEFCKPLVDGGMLVFVYGLFNGRYTGTSQALALIDEAQKLWNYCHYKTPIFLDVEVRDGMLLSTRVQRYLECKNMLRTAATRIGTYSSYSLWQELMGGLALYPDEIGWVAAWSRYPTFTPPIGWRLAQCLMRQIGVALKHEWVPPVPGMKSDVDVDEAYLTRGELLLLTSGTPPTPPPPDPGDEPMPTKQDALNLISDLHDEAEASLGKLEELAAVVEALDGTTPPTPPPTPPPSDDTWMMTTKTQTKAWCFEVWNETQRRLVEKRNGVRNAEYPKGQPIMQDYKDMDGELKIFAKGTKILTFKKLVNADGSRDYYECVAIRGDRNQHLFLWKDEVMKPY